MLNKTIALGTVQIGLPYGIANNNLPNEQSAIELLAYAYESGIRQFDTARAYGLSEVRIGKFIEQYKPERNSYSVASKILPIDENLDNVDEIATRSIEDSLLALKIDELDVLMAHRWANFKDHRIRRVFEKYNRHIKNLGASIQTPQELEEALNDSAVRFIQLPFNLIDWRWRAESIKCLINKRPDVFFQARSIYLQGLLINKCKTPVQNFDIEKLYSSLVSLKSQLKRLNLEDLCFAFVRSTNWINGIVFGVDNVSQIKSFLERKNTTELTKNELEQVYSLFHHETIPTNLLDPSQWEKE